MNTTVFVVVLVFAILLVLALIAVPLVRWLRRRGAAVVDELGAELAGETVLRGPEQGSYRGATADGYTILKNAGVIALTRRRLVFRTLTGKTIEVPLEAITRVREATVFKGSLVGGQTHLIVVTAAGEIGFYVFSGIGEWVATLESLVAG